MPACIRTESCPKGDTMQSSVLLKCVSRAFVVGIAVCWTACVKTDVVILDPTVKYEPVSPDSVRVFLTADDVPGEYQRVAQIDAYQEGDCSGWGCPDRDDMIAELRKKAGEVGCNGIVLDPIDPATPELQRRETALRVLAIRWKPDP